MGVLIARARKAKNLSVIKGRKKECNGFRPGPLALVKGRLNLAMMPGPRREQLKINDYEIES